MQRDNLEEVLVKTKSKFKKSKFSKTQFMVKVIEIRDKYKGYSSMLTFSLLRLSRNNFDEDLFDDVSFVITL